MAISGFSTSKYVNFGATATQYRITESITVCAWVYLTGIGGAAQHIISKTFPTKCYNLAIGAAGTWAFTVSTTGSNDIYALQSSALSTRTWYHLCGVYNKTDIRLFQNRSQVGTTQALKSSIYNATGSPLIIGAALNASPVQGIEFDARIYNVALSDAQIGAIYAAKGSDGITSGLVLRTCIADGCVGVGSLSGKKVYDHSSYKNHVTATGAPNAIVDPYDPWR